MQTTDSEAIEINSDALEDSEPTKHQFTALMEESPNKIQIKLEPQMGTDADFVDARDLKTIQTES